MINFFQFKVLKFLKTCFVLDEGKQQSDKPHFILLSKGEAQNLSLPAIWLRMLLPILLIFAPLFIKKKWQKRKNDCLSHR